MATIDLAPDLRARLLRLAEARHRTPDGLMQDAIAQYVSREEAREQLLVDAQAAWDEYRATGLHASGDEVDAWMARLEAGEEADPPACHR
jgi:predicted transcriptional regulator